MIRIFGPCNPRVTFAGPSLQQQPENPFCISAGNLGDALRAYETHFKVTIEPCLALMAEQSEYKYFNVSSSVPKQGGLVDIHVFRGDEEICPRQKPWVPSERRRRYRHGESCLLISEVIPLLVIARKFRFGD
jgi:hypothetical protein